MRKILITGAKGFIGRNLVCELKNQGGYEILQYDIDSATEVLEKYAKECDFVFHLAGVNRPVDPADFKKGNVDFTTLLLETLAKYGNKAPVLITSSIQATQNNLYGESKQQSEQLIFNYGVENNVTVYVYRLTNVFGKWCRPNYNSVVATFCHNIARELPIQINNPEVELNLVYIDDVISEFLGALEDNPYKEGDFCSVRISNKVKLGQIAEMLVRFRENRMSLEIPNMGDAFEKKLYSTYLSYLPEDSFSYPLKMNVDSRGSFTEFIRTHSQGQVSINISKPHIMKGNHWHHTKNEKFLVVSGIGVIRFRKIGEEKVIEYYVSGDKLEVVDIPTGYTHNIENLGEDNLITVMWANEAFDALAPDTFYEEVRL